MEIYNEHGYDLLAEDLESCQDVKKELPRVHLREDSDGNIHLRNLSAHPSGSEEEALNYLFVGDTNRHVSETTMNLESSRSHCIFTIFITASKIGSDTVRRSKIHQQQPALSRDGHYRAARARAWQEIICSVPQQFDDQCAARQPGRQLPHEHDCHHQS